MNLRTRTRLAAAAVTACAAILAGLSAGPASAAGHPASPATSTALAAAATGTATATASIRPPCTVARPRTQQCFLAYRPQTAVNRAIAMGRRGPASHPKGWSPQALESAYRLPTARQSDETVAVSIAYNTPHLGRFLSTYRKHYGLPPCTAASGCFRQVNQLGHASPLPTSGKNTGWDLEATLDVSMISAACPSCHIVVVEANNPGDTSLARTDGAAARLGAQVISNSYGGRENGFALGHRQAYIHPGHTIVASAGDLGFTAASFPADLASVVSVGGTTLTRSPSPRGWRERTWNDPIGAGGSGCSAYVRKPSWQHDRHCPGRTVADVSAVAANVPIFEGTYGGWVTVEGTSISAPLIAGIYGLAGNGGRAGPRDLYQHVGSLFDVTRGNNAFFSSARVSCGDDYLCVARKGYDAPTGLGTPDGIGAF
jgi:hypothetical protein